MRRTVLSPARRASRLVALALALSMTAACADKPDPPDADGATEMTHEDGSPVLPGEGGGELGSGGGGNGGATSSTTVGRTPTTTGGGTVTTARNSTGTTTATSGGSGGDRTVAPPADSPDSGARGGPGAFARTMLRPQPATRLVVEVLAQQGAAPTDATLSHLHQVLADVSKKQVTLVPTASIPAGDGTYNDADIRAMSDRHAKHAQGNGQAVIRLLFLTGRYEQEKSVLGVAVRGDTAAVFSDMVRGASTPFAPARTIEDAVTIHEVGHLLGLVDIVLKTGRADPKHEGHSSNPESVMYWAVESDIVAQALGGPPPREFDNADKADLAALRNGA
jgi:hypothetical protein